MAQFDVYVNPSAAQREGFPYVVVLQSDHLDQFTTRLVMPLARFVAAPKSVPRRLAGSVTVCRETLQLAAHLSAPLPARLLRARVESLRHESALLLDALDAVTSFV